MSEDFKRSPSSRALDRVVDEAKTQLDVPAEQDWAVLEARLMKRVEAEKPALVADQGRSGNGLRAVAFGLAIAASVALFIQREHETALDAPPPAHGENASSLRTTEGNGEIRVEGIVATPGYAVHPGDNIVAEGARAVFERPRKVTWLLESSSKARIKAAADPLVVGLVEGAIEAQVTPVPTGEAFAIDVAAASGVVRVAVHGTHLRVQRAGDHVVIDLTEGVVSIGNPPRTGTTYGALVNAPAHVELDANDLSTLKIDHAPAAVRAATSLGSHEPIAVNGANGAGHVDAPPAALPTPPSPAFVPKGRPTEGNAKSDPPKSALPPRDAITTAIHDCAAQASRSGNVQVTATSTLRLQVSSAGIVESAQFTPPLLPEIQTCAAQTIYKTKLDETGSVTIPVEFTF